jgi:hypothetical protein
MVITPGGRPGLQRLIAAALVLGREHPDVAIMVLSQYVEER